MGWNWGRGSRSYTAHAELGEHLSQIAPRSDWAAVSSLFNRGSGDPHDVAPGQARRMAVAFKSLAALASPEWRGAVYELGAAAAEAGRTNSVWHWS